MADISKSPRCAQVSPAGPDDKEQYLCGENTSPVTHWECTAELRTQLALLVSTRETVPFSSPAEKQERSAVVRSAGVGIQPDLDLNASPAMLDKLTTLRISFLFC